MILVTFNKVGQFTLSLYRDSGKHLVILETKTKNVWLYFKYQENAINVFNALVAIHNFEVSILEEEGE